MQLLTMRSRSPQVPVFRNTTFRQVPPVSRSPSSSPSRPVSVALSAPPQAVPQPEDPSLPRDVASRFGRRVRELRHARSMTQVEVAVHFGIDRTFLSDVERGRKGVCLPTMEVMALGFGISLSDLLRGI